MKDSKIERGGGGMSVEKRYWDPRKNSMIVRRKREIDRCRKPIVMHILKGQVMSCLDSTKNEGAQLLCRYTTNRGNKHIDHQRERGRVRELEGLREIGLGCERA